ncbi:MAG: hypothetical protein RSB36_02355, partial [Hydrogenoanaerobacterium sp.]
NEVYNYSYFTSNKKLREILVKYYFKSKNYKKDEIYSFKNDNKAGFVEKQKYITKSIEAKQIGKPKGGSRYAKGKPKQKPKARG